jgi:hypothetical protein
VTIPEERTYWLSFADGERPAGQQFLGVIVTRAWSIQAAIRRTHVLGVNPGGGVLSAELPDSDQTRAIPRDRLLSWADLEALGLQPGHVEGIG